MTNHLVRALKLILLILGLVLLIAWLNLRFVAFLSMMIAGTVGLQVHALLLWPAHLMAQTTLLLRPP
jgi:hypothetical protein